MKLRCLNEGDLFLLLSPTHELFSVKLVIRHTSKLIWFIFYFVVVHFVNRRSVSFSDDVDGSQKVTLRFDVAIRVKEC